MFRDKQPVGRERAIETLIDLEPSGARYRATRISVSGSSSPTSRIVKPRSPSFDYGTNCRHCK